MVTSDFISLGATRSKRPKDVQWVADEMRQQQAGNNEEKERLWDSVKLQIERVEKMDDRLYDDKLAGETSQEKYEAKHADFREQKAKLQEQLQGVDKSASARLDQTLVLLKLSQRAAEIYAGRTPQQKRLIITKLFQKMILEGDSLSVEYTDFTEIIAKNVVETKKLIGGQK